MTLKINEKHEDYEWYEKLHIHNKSFKTSFDEISE